LIASKNDRTLKMEPTFYIPEDLPITTTKTLVSAMVTQDVSVNIQLISGEEEDPRNMIDEIMSLCGIHQYNPKKMPANMFYTKPGYKYQLQTGSILTWVVGSEGNASSIYIDGELMSSDIFIGKNPVPGVKSRSQKHRLGGDTGRSGLLSIW